HLPQIFRPKRILPNQQRLEVFHRAHDRQFTPGNPAFTNAVNPLIGIHNDEGVISMARPDRITLNIGNLHDGVLLPKTTGTPSIPRTGSPFRRLALLKQVQFQGMQGTLLCTLIERAMNADYPATRLLRGSS